MGLQRNRKSKYDSPEVLNARRAIGHTQSARLRPSEQAMVGGDIVDHPTERWLTCDIHEFENRYCAAWYADWLRFQEWRTER